MNKLQWDELWRHSADRSAGGFEILRLEYHKASFLIGSRCSTGSGRLKRPTRQIIRRERPGFGRLESTASIRWLSIVCSAHFMSGESWTELAERPAVPWRALCYLCILQ